MSMTSAADVIVIITSTNSRSERRISPSWTIEHLKSKLEPITGIPAGCQVLSLAGQTINVDTSSATTVDDLRLSNYSELNVADTRPPGLRENYTDTSNTTKYEIPLDVYEKRTDSVLAWKKAQKLGRFDPHADEILSQKRDVEWKEVEERGVKVGLRCRLLPQATDARRGIVRYIGEIEEIQGHVGPWIGVELDEPTGKNDGSVEGKQYFSCENKRGVFVRAERVEIGDFPVIDEFADDDDQEF